MRDHCLLPCLLQEHERYYPTPPHPTPPHPSSNWWWKTTACCRACYRSMNVIIPPHPTPAVPDDERPLPVAVPVCVLEHERYYPTPPHPSSNWWWKTTACCRACACTGTWTLLSHPTPPHPSSNWWWKTTACCRACYRNMNVITPPHPTPPHPTPAVIRMFGNLTAASDRFIRSDKSFTAASGAVLLPQVTGKSHLPQVIQTHCRKWGLSQFCGILVVPPTIS